MVFFTSSGIKVLHRGIGNHGDFGSWAIKVKVNGFSCRDLRFFILITKFYLSHDSIVFVCLILFVSFVFSIFRAFVIILFTEISSLGLKYHWDQGVILFFSSTQESFHARVP